MRLISHCSTLQPFRARTVSVRTRAVGPVVHGVNEGCKQGSSYAVCPGLVKVNPNKHFSKVLVRICNLSARPVTVFQKSVICHLQEVNVVNTLDPSEASGLTVSGQVFAKPWCKSFWGCFISGVDKVEHFLGSWKSRFATGSTDLGYTDFVEHGIELFDPIPFKQPNRKIPPVMYEEVRAHVWHMITAGAIRKSYSPFSSKVVLVRKEDYSLRFRIDFRKSN